MSIYAVTEWMTRSWDYSVLECRGEIEELWESVDLTLLLRHRQITSLYIEGTVAIVCSMSHWTVIEPFQKKEILLLKIMKGSYFENSEPCFNSIFSIYCCCKLKCKQQVSILTCLAIILPKACYNLGVLLFWFYMSRHVQPSITS